MKIINYIKWLGLAIIGSSLISCGNGTCEPKSNNDGNLSLTLTAPNEYPAGVAVTAYLTIKNTSIVNATNLTYDVPNATNYTGATITVNPNGAGNN